MIQTADCTPVLIEQDGIVAVVHAGWRGIANGIILKVLNELGGFERALVGPLISKECYEVGLEVVEAIEAAGVPRSVFVHPHSNSEKAYVDVRAAAVWQLREGGSGTIDHIDRCTFKDPQLHSYRQKGAQAGRNFSCIGLH